MASRTEKNLSCPVCYEIFKDPVILTCSHSLCKACWQQWKTERDTLCCPVCRHNSLSYNPPINLALKNLCEDFLLERTEGSPKGSTDLCSLHAEKLKLFCLDDQQPACVICLHSNSHKNHRMEPIDEAALDYKAVLRELLKPSQERLELFNDIKRNFDQTAQDIELQAQHTERQIKDMFLMLQKFLQKEEQERIDAVMEEKKQKSQRMKRESTALSREITDLSDRIRATEDFLKAEDLSFLQNYKTTAERVNQSLPNVPHPISGLIDMTKHLNNLSNKVLDSMKEKVTSTLNLHLPYRKPTVLSGTSFLNCESDESHEYDFDSSCQSGAVSRRPLSMIDEPTHLNNLLQKASKSMKEKATSPLNLRSAYREPTAFSRRWMHQRDSDESSA